ncbi:MAG TPA: hypothetical protein VKA46_01750 [Gemmataceae bacterium]|nr:hypothetical protein [Gemmataceae bacterium]
MSIPPFASAAASGNSFAATYAAAEGASPSGEVRGLGADRAGASTEDHEQLEALFRGAATEGITLPEGHIEGYERLVLVLVSRREAVAESVLASPADARCPGPSDDLARALPSSAANQQAAPAALADPLKPPSLLAAARAAEGIGGLTLLPPGTARGDVPGEAALPPATDPPGESKPLGGEAHEVLPAHSAGGAEAVPFSAKAAALLDGALPFDLAALRQGVDGFFVRLGGLSEETEGVPEWLRFGPWLLLASGAGAELARRWQTKSSRRTVPGDDLPGLAPFFPGAER